MKKTIVITGGEGFVGSQIVKFLERNKITNQINFKTKKQTHKYYINKNISVFYTKNLFLEDCNWWIKILNNVDVFIHAAWYVKPEILEF